jgi:hypothetical protein
LVALVALVALATPQAYAQTASAGDSALLSPDLSGDPRKLPRFRRAGSEQDAAPSRFGQNFDYQGAGGAGDTGFDSTNKAGRKTKRGQKARPKVPALSKGEATSASATVARTGDLAPVTAEPSTPRAPTPSVLVTSGGSSRLQKLSGRQAVPVSDPGDPSLLQPVDQASQRRRVLQEQNPFDPTGIAVGAFLLRPAIEVTGAYDSNPARTTHGTPSWFYVVAPELRVNSNWAVHELTANLRGSYTGYEQDTSLNRPTVDARVNGRVDVRDGTRLDLEGRFLLATDNPGSPNLQAGLAKLPINATLGGTAGIGQRFNRFELTVKGLVDRTVYQASTFTDGSTASNDDRNYNRYANETRLSYELTPGVKPFVEGGADSRVHDLAFDHNGFHRDSTGYYIKGGSSFELSRILTGDVAVGWLARSYREPLPDIGGVTFDSSLTWLASALTTLKLTARTSVGESTLADVSGSFTREVALEVDHAFRRWLVATLKVMAGRDDYVGSPRLDDRYTVSTAIIYKLTREMQLKAEYRHELLRSNQAGADYDADVFLLGMRLQR